jgi:hypothetical protein
MGDTPAFLTDERIEQTMALGREMEAFLASQGSKGTRSGGKG